MKLTVLDGEKATELGGELTEEIWKSAGIRAGWYDNKGITEAKDIEIPELKVPEGLPEGEYPLELRRGL